MFKKKPKEKRWYFDYQVEFVDGHQEGRTGDVDAAYLVNAVDRAICLIEERTQADPDIIGFEFYSINLRESEEML